MVGGGELSCDVNTEETLLAMQGVWARIPKLRGARALIRGEMFWRDAVEVSWRVDGVQSQGQ